jgi:ankyrin repeat protein
MKPISAILEEYAELPEFCGMQLGTVNVKGHTGDSPLHVAVHRKDCEEVVAFLAAGADPDARGELGYTPLLIAVSKELPAIVKLLLQAGAQRDVANDDGLTPQRLAKSEEVRALLNQPIRRH